MRKKIILLMCFILILGFTACNQNSGGNQASNSNGNDYPKNDITGVVQWGAGGGTDSLMRPLATLAAEELGVSIVIQNKPGATGAIGTQYVYDQDADGYTLLMGAENPQLYDVLEISNLTYENFIPAFIIGDEQVAVVVNKDSKYNSFKELIDDALANPGTIQYSTTGTGGMPWTISTFIKAVTGAEFVHVPFDSDAACLTAVLGGHSDFTVSKIQTAIESYKAGEIKILTLMSTEESKMLPEVSSVVEEYPEFENYLPWGPFYGVFLKEGTDQAQVDILSEAFSTAFEDQTYQDLLESLSVNPLGYTGEEASEYLKSWRNNTIDAFEKSGAI